MQVQATSLAYIDTELSADCIEFCPFEGYQHFFVCGTYQVLAPEVKETTVNSDGSDDEDKAPSGPSQTRRTGRLLLFTVTEDENSVVEVQRMSTPAILDAKWCPILVGGKPQLAVGDAMGHVTIYSLSCQELTESRSIEVAEDKILCLSLDYAPSGNALIVSLSSGHLAHIPLEGDDEIQTFSAHMYEPWITSFDRADESGKTVWSGGDDLVMKKWDLEQTFRPSLVNKQFEAGVTTIAFSPHTPYLMAVGSYDCTLRLFDSRNPKTPLLQIQVGGGVWRTKFHPDPSRRAILLATMHDGFKVVELSERLAEGDKWAELVEEDAVVTTRFDGHESLAYGVDWCRLPPREGKSLVASCSFYDHAMHLWRE